MVSAKQQDRYWLLGVMMACIAQGVHASESLLQQQVNAALSLMTFTVTPDITASNLSINEGNGDSSDLLMTQLGGGATLSDEIPVYLAVSSSQIPEYRSGIFLNSFACS